jgi:hypothetical protein
MSLPGLVVQRVLEPARFRLRDLPKRRIGVPGRQWITLFQRNSRDGVATISLRSNSFSSSSASKSNRACKVRFVGEEDFFQIPVIPLDAVTVVSSVTLGKGCRFHRNHVAPPAFKRERGHVIRVSLRSLKRRRS